MGQRGENRLGLSEDYRMNTELNEVENDFIEFMAAKRNKPLAEIKSEARIHNKCSGRASKCER